MNSLRDRLKRLTGGSGSGVKSKNGTEPGDASVQAAEQPAPAGSAIEHEQPSVSEPLGDEPLDDGHPPGTGKEDTAFTVEPLDAEWSKLDAALVRNSFGSFIRRRRVYPWEHVHGEICLAELHGRAGELSSFHNGSSVCSDQLLFFDTETTGLGLGAGNVPFMIGLGFREEEGFAVEQLFIRNPAEELAMLAYLKPLMERYPYLVSYNGRTFDWPLLKNRFVMNRMKDGIAEPQHFDFLYPSRSLWKNTLPSCRLGKVEEFQLGFNRVDDVPGSMAPTLYFLYLAEKRPGDIAPVFVHNEWDILSLAGLAVLFARLLGGLNDPASKSPEEQYRLGLWLHKMGKATLSRKVLELVHAPASGILPEQAISLLVPLAGHYKQLGAWSEAVSLWQMSIQAVKDSGSRSSPPLESYIELSMYYEHRMKDYSAALLYAEEALAWTEDRISSLEAALRRSDRLQSRKRKGTWDTDPLTAAAARKSNAASGVTAELNKRINRLRMKRQKALISGSIGEISSAGTTVSTERSRKRRRKQDDSAHETFTLF